LPVRRVSLVGPYFDRDLRTLNRISEDLNPSEIMVGLQPGTAVLEALNAAPIGTRFVDVGVTGAFWAKAPGFVHGKAMLFETDAGPIVCLGSANPTSAGWLGGEQGNAEANILLTGTVASKAATELGLDLLMEASPISAETLRAVASRSQEERQRKLERDSASNSIPVVIGVRRGDAIVVRGVDLQYCQVVVSVQGAFEFHSVNFAATEGGIIITTEPPLSGGGLVRIDGPGGAVAIVVINDEQALRNAARPKAAAKLLDHLGRLESYDGFDEIFDLLQRHVFDETGSSGKVGISRLKSTFPDESTPEPAPDAALPFGPRGISIAAIQKPRHQNHLLENGLVSEVIAALICAIGPVSKPVVDGDGRNLDAEDARSDELSADDLAQGHEADLDPDVDWPRLVTACRKRISVMINRLREKVSEPIPGSERAAWLFNRILLVLCLLQRLRTLPPASTLALDSHRRPASLVGVNQLREAFKLAMNGLYGARGIARLLEASPTHRASDDRAILDDVLLWTAHEIGADYKETPVFNEQPAEKARRLGDRADVVVVAMSAAARLSTYDEEALNHSRLEIWDDSATLPSDWVKRHRRLGAVLQSGLSGKCLPTLKRKPKVGEFAFWVAEPGLPRLVQSLSGDKVTLFEPGADDGGGRKFVAAFLDAIDLDAIVAA
jgi:hypothetical protein